MTTLLLTYAPPRLGGLNYVRVERLHTCDLPDCRGEARYDAKTPQGPWAYLCQAHARIFGIALGMGRGQLLLLPGEEVPW